MCENIWDLNNMEFSEFVDLENAYDIIERGFRVAEKKFG